jgi:hypothetical protein
MKEKEKCLYFSMLSVDLAYILFKLVPLAMVVMGTDLRGQSCTSGCFQPPVRGNSLLRVSVEA